MHLHINVHFTAWKPIFAQLQYPNLAYCKTVTCLESTYVKSTSTETFYKHHKVSQDSHIFPQCCITTESTWVFMNCFPAVWIHIDWLHISIFKPLVVFRNLHTSGKLSRLTDGSFPKCTDDCADLHANHSCVQDDEYTVWTCTQRWWHLQHLQDMNCLLSCSHNRFIWFLS